MRPAENGRSPCTSARRLPLPLQRSTCGGGGGISSLALLRSLTEPPPNYSPAVAVWLFTERSGGEGVGGETLAGSAFLLFCLPLQKKADHTPPPPVHVRQVITSEEAAPGLQRRETEEKRALSAPPAAAVVAMTTPPPSARCFKAGCAPEPALRVHSHAFPDGGPLEHYGC